MLRAVAAVLFLFTACTAATGAVEPHNGSADCDDSSSDCFRARFFWPTGLAISPDESTLFVANANSDLTYNAGTVDVLDLNKVEDALAPWTAADPAARHLAPGCRQDTDFSETMICHETTFLETEAGVRIGNFATAIGLQATNSGGDLRLIVPVRGDPSVTWIEWMQAKHALTCTDDGATGGLPGCDPDHRLTRLRNDQNQPALLDEPFDVFVDSVNEFAVVTHLATGSATLVDLPKAGTPIIADAISGLFGADPNTGAVGSSAVAGRDPNGPDDIIYVASRTEDRVQTFTVARPRGGYPLLDPGDYFFLNTVGSEAGSSRDTRGMAFGSGGDRMYLINRSPPSLQIYDTSIAASGAPKNEGVASTDICREASRLVLADSGDGDRAYVACFDDGQIYVVDPRNGAQVVDVIAVGRGPYDVVASLSKKRLYVTNYLEDTISVIDINPGSPTRNRVVLRLGEPRKP